MGRWRTGTGSRRMILVALGALACGCGDNFSSDAHNCGSSGHDCLGGTCSSGMCQPVALVTGPRGLPLRIALDGASLYWTEMVPDNGGIWTVMKVPLHGGVATTLASGSNGLNLVGLAVNASGVYWGEVGSGSSGLVSSLVKVAPSGGSVVTLASVSPVEMSVVAASETTVYFGYSQSSGQQTKGALMQIPVTGGAPATLASGQIDPSDIALDSANVYWTDNYAGTVVQQPRAGGAQTVLQTGVLTAGIAANSENVYWLDATNAGGAQLRSGPGGGAPDAGAPSTSWGQWLAVDSTYAYRVGQQNGFATITRTPLAGGAPVVLASASSSICDVAVDATSIYWITGDATFRLAK